MFGSVKAPPNKGCRPRSVTRVMLEALCDHILEKPNLDLEEAAIFCGTNSISSQQNLALAACLRTKDGQSRLPGPKLESVI